MTTVTVELLEAAFSALRRTPEEFAHAMRIAAAIRWYQQGLLSQEKAALIAGLTRAEFLDTLAREKVDVFHVDMAGLQQEIDRA